MVIIVNSAVPVGISAQSIQVQISVEEGAKSCRLLGLTELGAKESLVRVRAALDNSGFPFPMGSVRITLTPGDIREGSPLDLAIALGLLAAQGIFPSAALGQSIVLGELAMDGAVRVPRGALVVALHAARSGCRLLYPWDCRGEVRLGLAPAALLGVSTLRQAVNILRGDEAPPPDLQWQPEQERKMLDVADIAGLEGPKRALEIAAAGGHNLLLVGPPGTGKSMLARRLPGLLPPLSAAEALETTAIYSAAGLLGGSGQPALVGRPFRAPHHTVSIAGLMGGGAVPRPGEVSLAHHGVLFLDDLPEFKRPALEALRHALPQRKITVAQGRQMVTYPADFLLVGAMMPCPCGREVCTCREESKALYQDRISAVAHAFDLVVQVPQVSVRSLLGSGGAESSAQVMARVEEARARQRQRPAITRERELRVARTIADLAGASVIKEAHYLEARSLCQQ